LRSSVSVPIFARVVLVTVLSWELPVAENYKIATQPTHLLLWLIIVILLSILDSYSMVNEIKNVKVESPSISIRLSSETSQVLFIPICVIEMNNE
jgi:hypothetical protein